MASKKNPVIGTVLGLSAFILPAISIILICLIVIVAYRVVMRGRRPRDPPSSVYMSEFDDLEPNKPQRIVPLKRPLLHDVWLMPGEKVDSKSWEGILPLTVQVEPLNDATQQAPADTSLSQRRQWHWPSAQKSTDAEQGVATMGTPTTVGILIQLPSPVTREASIEEPSLLLGLKTLPYNTPIEKK